jgi:hypothetical protein
MSFSWPTGNNFLKVLVELSVNYFVYLVVPLIKYVNSFPIHHDSVTVNQEEERNRAAYHKHHFEITTLKVEDF